MRMLGGLLGVALGGGAALAQNQGLVDCTAYSTQPLEVTIPACTALIEAPDALTPYELATAYIFRAEAYERGISQHGSLTVDPDEMMAAALADLDMAVATDPRGHRVRADFLFRSMRFAEAIEDYTAAIAAAPDTLAIAFLLEDRAFAYAADGDLATAIEDMTAAVRVAPFPEDRVGLLNNRADLRERAGDAAGAAADRAAAAAVEAE